MLFAACLAINFRSDTFMKWWHLAKWSPKSRSSLVSHFPRSLNARQNSPFPTILTILVAVWFYSQQIMSWDCGHCYESNRESQYTAITRSHSSTCKTKKNARWAILLLRNVLTPIEWHNISGSDWEVGDRKDIGNSVDVYRDKRSKKCQDYLWPPI